MTTIDRAELMRWNAANERARREYRLHPIVSTYAYCRNRNCPCRKYEAQRDTGSKQGETWENKSGPSRGVDAPRPGPDHLVDLTERGLS